ncbi:hypothetical protein TCE0_013r00954 [Talaromyces pinophilus]|uniref:Uncharacterized protein n=1 Tax=Talaromyces pinophilus TaxID=128442 RepID=A0A698XLX6_TALPI|nr:hypothetical protein TCE0_013r00954 [Talaromyces pinophilus]
MPIDTLSLEGKAAIVTGSGRENGIGAAIALALARNGAAVTINYVSAASAERAENVAKKIRSDGGRATVVAADVSTSRGAQTLVQETLKNFGVEKIDILINNVGMPCTSLTLDVNDEELHQLFSTNVYSAIFMAQSTIPYMPPALSKLGFGNEALYGASKAAMDALSFSWAHEFGKSRGITVNTVAPGPVMTDASKIQESTDEAIPAIIGLTRAADRLGTSEDVADAVLLLVSEKSRWITGQYVSASGGMTGL